MCAHSLQHTYNYTTPEAEEAQEVPRERAHVRYIKRSEWARTTSENNARSDLHMAHLKLIPRCSISRKPSVMLNGSRTARDMHVHQQHGNEQTSPPKLADRYHKNRHPECKTLTHEHPSTHNDQSGTTSFVQRARAQHAHLQSTKPGKKYDTHPMSNMFGKIIAYGTPQTPVCTICTDTHNYTTQKTR